jgi:6-phosphogluconolactonase
LPVARTPSRFIRFNQETGERALIQSADTRGVHPRTFAIDPSGRILVVANQQQILVRDKEEVRPLLATLSVFRIGDNGKLEFVRKYDQDTSGERALYWTGMVGRRNAVTRLNSLRKKTVRG